MVKPVGMLILYRLREHMSATNRGDPRNALFKHVSQTGHFVSWDSSNLLYKSFDWYHRLVVESSFILSYDNFNFSRSTLAIDNLSASIIINSIPNQQPP